MDENRFMRFEEKYLLTELEKEELFQRIDCYLQKDEYFKSTICNIYFDNLNYDLIVSSLEKPSFKEKIRLRSYGVPDLSDTVFLEIKRKYKGVSFKRRVKMTLEEFYLYFEQGKYNRENQLMKEIDYCFRIYNLKPTIYIAYDRESYKDESSNLRITLDKNLRSRRDDLKLELGDCGKKYFKENYYIMEIKTLNSYPIWLAKSLSELKVYPISFSKYGKIYEHEKRRN